VFTFVNDGSTDATLKVIEDMASQRPSRISVHHLSKNGGKAEAVRRGMLHVLTHNNLTTSDVVAFWDADLVCTRLREKERANATKNDCL